MGALDEWHSNGETVNGLKLACLELGSEHGKDAIEDAVKVLLQGLGEDPNREGLRKTPLRVATAFREGTRGYRQKVKDIVQDALFPEAGLDSGNGQAGGTGGLVVVRDIDLFSYCESCLLPFQVRCHIGYVPSGKVVVGLSKLSRVADVFAKRLQEPQRLADEVCSALHSGIKPAGVAVVLQCWHIHCPEVEQINVDQRDYPTKVDMHGWAKLVVHSCSGVFEDGSGDGWNDFLALLKFRGVSMEKNHARSFASQNWCPSKSFNVLTSNGNGNIRHLSNGRISSNSEPSHLEMINTVASILQSLGEDPSRKELMGTPSRFVQWLMNFKRSNLDTKPNGFGNVRTSSFNLNRHRNNFDVDVSHDQDEILPELNLPFCSQCEHHLLPFHGVVHIGYFHAKRSNPIERSILQSIVHFYGFKLQVQERLTRQIAESVSSVCNGDVMVVVEANHICMISRGIEKVGSSTATIAVLGRFSTDPTAKAIFLQTISSTTASGG